MEKAELDEKKFNFLYTDENECHFMDNTNFEQITISKKTAGEKFKLLKENLEVSIKFLDDKPIAIDLPINMQIAE